MTIMRVTVGSVAYSGLEAIRSTSANLATLQEHMSSGKQILKPSDDPVGTVQAMGLRSALARNDQYATNSDDATAWLNTADTAYGQMVTLVQSAQTIALKGMNTGVNDATANAALATQIDGVRAALIGLANTSYNGRPIFGGTTAGGVAYDTSGTYVGDSGTVTRTIGANSTVAVNSTGPDVFGSGSDDVFATLANMSSALRTDPSTLGSSLAQLTSAVSRLSTAQAGEGATLAQVQNAQDAQTTAGTTLQTQLSGIEEIDPAAMAIQLTTANTAYQAALQTTASIRQLSLLDFLR